MNSLTDSFILPLIADVASAVTHEGLWPSFSAYLEIICNLSGCLVFFVYLFFLNFVMYVAAFMARSPFANGSFSGWIDKWMNLRWSYMLAQVSVLNWNSSDHMKYLCFVLFFTHLRTEATTSLETSFLFVHVFLSHLGEGPERGAEEWILMS